jgi:hypothetical protein
VDEKKPQDCIYGASGCGNGDAKVQPLERNSFDKLSHGCDDDDDCSKANQSAFDTCAYKCNFFVTEMVLGIWGTRRYA